MRGRVPGLVGPGASLVDGNGSDVGVVGAADRGGGVGVWWEVGDQVIDQLGERALAGMLQQQAAVGGAGVFAV